VTTLWLRTDHGSGLRGLQGRRRLPIGRETERPRSARLRLSLISSGRVGDPVGQSCEQHAVEQHKRREPGRGHLGARRQERTGRQCEYRKLEWNPDRSREPVLRVWCHERRPQDDPRQGTATAVGTKTADPARVVPQ
jgi:hypothetical protein